MKNIPEELDGGSVDITIKETLDNIDKKILSLIQSGFPLESRPYAVIAQKVGITEEEALERVRNLRKKGIVRRIGANFQSANLGFKSTLCSACVPEEKIESFIAEVNSHTEVTHNYLRDHKYNLWFTCIGPSDEHIQKVLDTIVEKTGVTVNNLPATRLYKIRVDFALT